MLSRGLAVIRSQEKSKAKRLKARRKVRVVHWTKPRRQPSPDKRPCCPIEKTRINYILEYQKITLKTSAMFHCRTME